MKTKSFDKYIREKDPIERENKLKKFIVGNVNFISELIKVKMLSKKIMPECIEYLLNRYDNDEERELKLIHAQAIVLFSDRFGAIINEEKNNLKPDEVKKFKDKIEDIFKKLEIMKNDEELPGHIKYLIINLIEKKKNNYQESKFEKSLKAKSKKEVEEELKNKDNNNEKNKEKQQMEINDKIKTDLYDYKDFVEEEGSSEKYLWAITTELYNEKLKEKNKKMIEENKVTKEKIEERNRKMNEEKIKSGGDIDEEMLLRVNQLEIDNEKLKNELKDVKKENLDYKHRVQDFEIELAHNEETIKNQNGLIKFYKQYRTEHEDDIEKKKISEYEEKIKSLEESVAIKQKKNRNGEKK